MPIVFPFPSCAVRPNFLQLRQGEEREYVNGHEHNFDHLTIAMLGRFYVELKIPDNYGGIKNGHGYINAPTAEQVKNIQSIEDIRQLIEGCCRNIPANWCHKITGLDEVNMFLCCYTPRNEDGEMTEIHPKNTEEYYKWITGWPLPNTGQPTINTTNG